MRIRNPHREVYEQDGGILGRSKGTEHLKLDKEVWHLKRDDDRYWFWENAAGTDESPIFCVRTLALKWRAARREVSASADRGRGSQGNSGLNTLAAPPASTPVQEPDQSRQCECGHYLGGWGFCSKCGRWNKPGPTQSAQVCPHGKKTKECPECYYTN